MAAESTALAAEGASQSVIQRLKQFNKMLVFIMILDIVMVVVTFCIPELKGRSLEEVDQLFASGISLRKLQAVG
ncbi:hypothetical protein CTA1_11897 [Colletotrichum tanaceti]|uniref:Uncharacterized protein n=1 Tax=Colletotrichum tanaceti TaxID=1306861 RepID=A0A4U6X051_9PEZI|nr:hypothetical protein CTA1_11897 [Colletotrichum tanaceti]